MAGTPAKGSALTPIIESLRPHLREYRYRLHLIRGSALAMVGLGIVLFFVFLALFGPLISPVDYEYDAEEKNSPPWSQVAIRLNGSALDISGPWIGTAQYLRGWDELQRTGDPTTKGLGLYVRSDTVGNVLEMRRFGFVPKTDDITYVGVLIQANSTEGAAGSYLNLSVTWDNGVTWSAPQATPLRFSDFDGAWFTYEFTDATDWNASSLTDANFAVRAVHEVDPPFAPGPIGIDVVAVVVRYNGPFHALGSTTDGEDVLAGLLMGAPISMRIGIIVVVSATLIGSLLGALAGYFGGALDEIVMRVTDVFLSIPGLILAMAVAAAIGRSLDNVMIALIVVYWPPYTRLVRGQTLSIRENTYIEAARASGASEMRVVTRHVMPNVLSPIIVQASLDMGSVVLVAAGLSFLGLGAQPGTPEWGLMVSRGFSFFPPAGQNWWQVTFSGFFIFMFVLGFNLFGDAMRDILDPRIRR